MVSSTSISTMQNPSVVLYGPGTMKVEDRPVEQSLGDKDVLVRIAFVGTCGSDVHFWKHGGINTMVNPDRGIVMGHEASGTIESVGSGVESVKVGDRVAIEPGTPCRHCKPCKSGTYNLCRRIRFAAAPAAGKFPDTAGTLSKYFKIASDFVYKLPDSINLKEAVLVEPLGVAVHAAKLIDVRPGDTVVVLGSGTIGLLCAATAQTFGARRVVLVDVLEGKLEVARGWLPGVETFRAEIGVGGEETAVRLLRDLGVEIDDGVDVVIEASGAADSIATGIQVLRPGGRFVQTGLGKPKIEFPIVELGEKELLVRGCFRYGAGDFELAIGLIEQGKVNVKGLISSVVEFEDVVMAWERTAKGEGVKNLIRGVRD